MTSTEFYRVKNLSLSAFEHLATVYYTVYTPAGELGKLALEALQKSREVVEYIMNKAEGEMVDHV